MPLARNLTISSFVFAAHSKPLAFGFDAATEKVIISHTNEERTGWVTLFQPRTHESASAMQVLPGMIFSIFPLAGLSRCVAIGPGANASALYFLDLEEYVVRRTVQFRESTRCLLADPENNTVYLTCASNERSVVYTIDGASGAVRNSAPVGHWAQELALDSTRSLLFVINYRAQSLPKVDARTGVLLDTIMLPCFPAGIVVDVQAGQVFVPTLKAGLLALGSSDGTVHHQMPGEQVYGMPEGALAEHGMGFDAAAHRLVLGYLQGMSEERPSAVTVLDTQTWEVVSRCNLPGRVRGVFTHGGKHHTYVLYQIKDWDHGERGQRLGMQVLNTYTGAILHEGLVAGEPRNFLLVESLNQLFIADWDMNVVVCVEDRIPASVNTI